MAVRTRKLTLTMTARQMIQLIAFHSIHKNARRGGYTEKSMSTMEVQVGVEAT